TRGGSLRYTPMMLKNTSEEAFSIWVTLVASLPKIQPDTNLLYVAVTRAMKILAVNSLVIDIMQRFKDMLQRSRP
ncbi:hypothetical protein H2239_23005, partial [Pseudomonas savastanoi pv. savastanoi]|nr:hypothetical protein [Pseudomonas savastanoi pv. savastanoi]